MFTLGGDPGVGHTAEVKEVDHTVEVAGLTLGRGCFCVL